MKVKISNLRDVTRTKVGTTSYKYEGTVDVTITKGFWFFKKVSTEERRVFKPAYEIGWRFLDTGEHAPLLQMDALVKAYFHKQNWND